MMSTLFAAFSSTALRPSASLLTQCGPSCGPARHGDAAAGAEEARRAGDRLVAHVEKFEAVLAKTQRRADAVVGALLQVADEHVARLAEMGVRVDDHRHHGLAGEVDARRAGGHAHVGGPAGLQRSSRRPRRTSRSRSRVRRRR